MQVGRTISSKSQTLAVFEALREDILDVRLEPGSRLHVASLVERFGASQGAVREALSRLVADGLAIAIDQKGFRVGAVSVEDLRDLTQTRIELESVALRRSLEHGDAAWEARVLASYHELSKATPAAVEQLDGKMVPWGVLHRRFHEALVSGAPSEWMQRFRGILFDQSERYRKLSVSHPAGPRDVNEEHRRLMQAALDRNVAQCESLIAEHFQATARIVSRALELRQEDAK